MSTEYTGIPYFPLYSNFFENDVLELLEAKFGIRASCITIKLLCKIYKEGYFIPWGEEQSLIFIRKTGGEISETTMEQIIDLLFEKEFFNKKSFEQFGILTSENIQKVWLEATVRRKRNFEKMPYLLVATAGAKQDNGEQKEDMNGQDAGNLPTQNELNPENGCNSGQTKQNQTKADIEEELESETPFVVPTYAYNKNTHNLTGLVESLKRYNVTDLKEQQVILRLSDFGKKGTAVWKLFSNTHWNKINTPGRYIIAALIEKRKNPG